jgi:hypothetical protein
MELRIYKSGERIEPDMIDREIDCVICGSQIIRGAGDELNPHFLVCAEFIDDPIVGPRHIECGDGDAPAETVLDRTQLRHRGRDFLPDNAPMTRLADKYRPVTFDRVLGQDREIAQIEHLDGKPPDAYKRLVAECDQNFREALGRIESGEMLR